MTRCRYCGKDLPGQENVYAALGSLYCSVECVHCDIPNGDDLYEEILADDIGLTQSEEDNDETDY